MTEELKEYEVLETYKTTAIWIVDATSEKHAKELVESGQGTYVESIESGHNTSKYEIGES